MRRVLVLAAVVMLAACSNERSAAYKACSAALRDAAKNPSSAVIPKPKVEPLRHMEGLVLSWGRGDGLLFMNNMGALLDTTADCVVVDGRVAILSIDNRPVRRNRVVEQAYVRQLEEDIEAAQGEMRAAMDNIVNAIEQSERSPSK